MISGSRSKSVLLACVLVFCISTSAICAPAGYVKVWEDTFDGSSLNTDNWTIGMRDPGTSDLVPGAAGRYYHNTSYANYITAEDVIVSGGSLYLQNQKRTYVGSDPAGTYEYTSGWIMSMHKVLFNKGYVEMRAKFPSGDKVWPALWLIAEDLIWGPEWDMFEYFGYRSDRGYDVMLMNLAYGSWPSISWLGNTIYGFDTTYDCEAWHIYGFEWTPSYAKFTIDGSLVYQMNNTIGGNWPDEQMYIVLNNGVRTSSPDTNTTWPNYVVMDYIELYQLVSGCGDGTCDGDEDECSCSEDCGDPVGDLDLDCQVANTDFGRFALEWQNTGCGVCGGADFSFDGNVGFDDLLIFEGLWLTDYSLMAYWPLDGDAADSSRYNHSSTIFGSPTWDPNGRIGQALICDGTDDYINVDLFKGILGGKSRTVSAWIKTTQADGEILTFGQMTTTGGRWVFRVAPSGKLNVQVGGGTISGTTVLTDGNWHHVAAVLENDWTPTLDEVKLYVDGIAEAVTGVAPVINTILDNDVKIGVFSDTANYFQGLIDEVRIYSRALTEAEIQSLAGM